MKENVSGCFFSEHSVYVIKPIHGSIGVDIYVLLLRKVR